MLKRNLGDYSTLIIATALLLLVFGIAIFTFIKTLPSQESQTNTPTQTVLPTVENVPNNQISIVRYDEAAEEQLLEKMNTRQLLSKEDTVAKAKIISLIPGDIDSGIVYQTNTLKIDYVSNPDIFRVEILTTNISQAKAEANVWFRQQGLSQEGICNMPVMFYLNSEVSDKLKDSGTVFSPLANSC